MFHVLEQELKTFEENRAELLASAEGKFALVHGGDIVEIFTDEQDAIRHGYSTFGNIPFLVKQVLAVETAANFVNNHVAL